MQVRMHYKDFRSNELVFPYNSKELFTSYATCDCVLGKPNTLRKTGADRVGCWQPRAWVGFRLWLLDLKKPRPGGDEDAT